MKNSSLHRVEKSRPCPVCHKPDWCVVAGDPEDPPRVFCQRVESSTRVGALGFLHVLRQCPLDSYSKPLAPKPIDHEYWEGLAASYVRALEPGRLRAFSEGLGVSAESLRLLGVGWTGQCWSFPMYDDRARTKGIRLRRPDGFKYAVRGSSQGLFMAASQAPPRELWVTEGPTDAAALLSIGLPVIGRPSCMGCEATLSKLLTRAQCENVVVVADADGPGRRGARDLALVLAGSIGRVTVIEPPGGVGDAREAIRRGADINAFVQKKARAMALGLGGVA